MKSFIREFIKRGFVSAWGGPAILAFIYFIIEKNGTAESISLSEASISIFSMTVMAFIAGGITAIYQNEKLPVATSALIHAAVLYIDYLIMYLMNGWLPKNKIGIFTLIFAAGFIFIWIIIYFFIKSKTDDINRLRSKNI